MRRILTAALVAGLVTPALPGRAPASSSEPDPALRVVAASYKQDLAHAESYAAYAAHMREVMQRVRPHLTPEGANLVVLPEAASLVTWLTGPRGAAARRLPALPDSSSLALASLAVPYAPQAAYYAAKCPGIPPARALFLALTDTVWRAFGETFASIARDEHAWVLVNAYVGDVRVVRDPLAVALLADPVAGTSYAYEAGCDVWNQAMLFDPSAPADADGAADPSSVLAGVQRKAYLVPVEREQRAGLALSSESPDEVHPLRIPVADGAVAKVGVVTSKDAWMNDLPERLDIEGMDLFVQPEAGGWAGVGEDGGADPWPQDALYRSAPAETNRLPNTRMGVVSTLHGNLFDLYFDGTPTIAVDRADRTAHTSLLGMQPDAAIAARGPWVADDDPLAALGPRRAALAEAGRALLPGSGDPRENGQLEPVVSADLTIRVRRPAPRAPSADGTSTQVFRHLRGRTWQPRIAVGRGGTLMAVATAFTSRRPGTRRSPSIAFARSESSGTWAYPPWSVEHPAPREYDQQDMVYDPAVAALRGLPVIAWSAFPRQSWDLYASHAFGLGYRVDGSPSSGEGFPNENFEGDPDVAVLRSGRILVAYDDARGTRPDRGIVVARSDDAASWTETRADGDQPPADPLGRGADAWHPAIAAGSSGAVALAWQDQRDGGNGIAFARSLDGGVTFSAPVRLDDATGADEAFLPDVVVDENGTAHVAWEQTTPDGGRAIVRTSVPMSGPPSPPAAVDVARPARTVQSRVALALGADGTLYAAWGDDRAGDDDVLASLLPRGGTSFTAPLRIDDTGSNDARLPSIAVRTDGSVVVAWEDASGGVTEARSVLLQSDLRASR